MVRQLFAYRPHVLYGNRTHIDMICAELEARGERYRGLKFVAVTAEVIREPHRQRYRALLQTDVIETYGSVEMGTMTFETREHNGLLLCEDLFHFEFLNDRGVPAQAGEYARIVVTSLSSALMPLIRYEQGDRVLLLPAATDGRGWRRLQAIHGRDDDVCTLPGGERVSFHLFYEIMDQYDGIHQFRIIQKTPSSFRILIAADAQYVAAIRAPLLAQYGTRFPPPSEFVIERVDRLDPDPSGKLRMLISEV